MTMDGYLIMIMLTSNANIIFVDVMCFSSSYTAQIDLQYVLNMKYLLLKNKNSSLVDLICFVSELTKGEFVSVSILIVIFLDIVIIG